MAGAEVTIVAILTPKEGKKDRVSSNSHYPGNLTPQSDQLWWWSTAHWTPYYPCGRSDRERTPYATVWIVCPGRVWWDCFRWEVCLLFLFFSIFVWELSSNEETPLSGHPCVARTVAKRTRYADTEARLFHREQPYFMTTFKTALAEQLLSKELELKVLKRAAGFSHRMKDQN